MSTFLQISFNILFVIVIIFVLFHFNILHFEDFLKFFESKFGKSFNYSLPNVNDFGQDLVKILDVTKGGEHENVMVSPFSVNTALLMTAVGAKNDTFSEFLKVLKISSLNDSEHILKDEEIKKTTHGKKPFISANSMWVNNRYEVRKNYIESIKDTFDSSIFPCNFASPLTAPRVNLWVSGKTHGMINHIVEGVGPDETMILINAFFFKGKWKDPFKSGKSTPGPFYRTDGSKKETTYMCTTRKYDYYSDDSIAAAVLPFASGPNLLVLLPKRRGEEALTSVAQTYFTNDKIVHVLSTAQFLELDMEMPRFDISNSLSLKDPLKQLGLVSAFGVGAEFPLISSSPLSLNDVLHQAVFSVNEKGVKAAAVTVVAHYETCGPPPKIPVYAPIPFHVYIPFAFVLLHGRTALFMGIVRDVSPEK